MKIADNIPVSPCYLKQVTMGEGETPVVEIDPGLFAKLDYMMPTLSFKDRGSSVLIAQALEMGVKKVIQDSSGNAGCSVAAYSARAGIEAIIYLADSTSEQKIKMIEAYGATVVKIKGSREDVASAAREEVKRSNIFYASHVHNPTFAQGMKSYIYEVFDQFNGKLPGTIFVPLGNGTLFYGIYHGIKDLIKYGYVHKFPKITAIQAFNCAPLYHSYIKGIQAPYEIVNQGTVANGIAIAKPANGSDILKITEEIGAEIIAVTEQEISEAHQYLAKKGFYVELTSAVNYAGYKKYISNNKEATEELCLITLCGASK